ncbi:hypothetical protein B4123_1072 [Bacillus paralicheniformis]|nr:hypothetical protein B4123_2277 [Bacillus paralicheniformis]OLG11731.1 hypothetical protein B4123_1839 [Bacillus paralicheniformis]OLG12480.1 hypothetical protein B4123_1072 [Bacillus paralicheniformis]TWJ47682.1 hypothetical protein CHCC5027_4107 [Bacillus paralicheniformis]TWJ59131.1 hypothetical protein CHCC5023_0179 [Bacillus paralicheniformis]
MQKDGQYAGPCATTCVHIISLSFIYTSFSAVSSSAALVRR